LHNLPGKTNKIHNIFQSRNEVFQSRFEPDNALTEDRGIPLDPTGSLKHCVCKVHLRNWIMSSTISTQCPNHCHRPWGIH